MNQLNPPVPQRIESAIGDHSRVFIERNSQSHAHDPFLHRSFYRRYAGSIKCKSPLSTFKSSPPPTLRRRSADWQLDTTRSRHLLFPAAPRRGRKKTRKNQGEQGSCLSCQSCTHRREVG